MMRLTVLFASLCIPASAAPLVPLSNADFAASVSRVSVQTSVLSAKFMAASIDIQDAQIVASMREQNPEVRIAALKYARSTPRIQHAVVRQQVSAMAANESDLDAKVEAVRTLYWVTSPHETQQLLFRLARQDQSPRVRSMAYKAQHTIASHTSTIASDIVKEFGSETDLEVQKAAVWALFESGGFPIVRDTLLRVSADADLDQGLRVAAVKSLYGAMQYSEIWHGMLRLANDATQPKDLRLAAILVLNGSNSSEVIHPIEALLRNSDPDVRAAALQAAGNLTPELRRFFHLGYTVANQYISPIENE